MKKLILSLVAVLLATVGFAQSTLVATLSHEGNISVFYGAYALQDALEAAEDGDAICLSGGTFQGANITKAVALSGTGIDVGTPTCIINNYTINIQSTDTTHLSMEGIRCTGTVTMDGTFYNAQFLKCQFYAFNHESNAAITNALFVNCKITDGYSLRGNSTVQFVNGYMYNFHNYAPSTSSALFMNCIVRPCQQQVNLKQASYANYMSNSHFYNCIIYITAADYRNSLPSTSTAYNCISIYAGETFNDAQVAVNCVHTDYSIFKTFKGTYSDTETFELTESAKEAYFGTDSTEIGIYGGSFPYDPTPTNPQITKCIVASKSTVAGKLSVDIEVNGNKQ